MHEMRGTITLTEQSTNKLDQALVDVFNGLYGDMTYGQQFGIHCIDVYSHIYKIIDERKWVYARLKYGI